MSATILFLRHCNVQFQYMIETIKINCNSQLLKVEYNDDEIKIIFMCLD
uniref:Uncharacterized protein n=1 Tax=Setaria italica TaxID=4555 RepID=K3YNT0_SETIT